jgi:hypothetical protein
MPISTKAAQITEITVSNDVDMGFKLVWDNGDLNIEVDDEVVAFVPYDDLADFLRDITNMIEAETNKQ